jgi:hypothetical protein
MLGEGTRQGRTVEQIARDEGAGDEAAMTCREIVINDGLIAGGGQCAAGVRANIARASCDEDSRSVGHVVFCSSS